MVYEYSNSSCPAEPHVYYAPHGDINIMMYQYWTPLPTDTHRYVDKSAHADIDTMVNEYPEPLSTDTQHTCADADTGMMAYAHLRPLSTVVNDSAREDMLVYEYLKPITSETHQLVGNSACTDMMVFEYWKPQPSDTLQLVDNPACAYMMVFEYWKPQSSDTLQLVGNSACTDMMVFEYWKPPPSDTLQLVGNSARTDMMVFEYQYWKPQPSETRDTNLHIDMMVYESVCNPSDMMSVMVNENIDDSRDIMMCTDNSAQGDKMEFDVSHHIYHKKKVWLCHKILILVCTVT